MMLDEDEVKDKKRLLHEIQMEEYEKDALKMAFNELEEIDKEIMDEHKIVEMLDEKIVFCYEKLYEVLEKLTEMSNDHLIDSDKLTECEEIHNQITEVASNLGKYLEKINEDTKLEKRGLLMLEKHFDTIRRDLNKNNEAIHKLREKIHNEMKV